MLEDNADASWVIRLNGDGNGEDRGPEVPRTLMHRKIKDGEILTDRPLTLKAAAESAYLDYDAFEVAQGSLGKRAQERAGEVAEMLTDIRSKSPSRDLTARSLAREMGWNWDRKITREVINIYLNE